MTLFLPSQNQNFFSLLYSEVPKIQCFWGKKHSKDWKWRWASYNKLTLRTLEKCACSFNIHLFRIKSILEWLSEYGFQWKFWQGTQLAYTENESNLACYHKIFPISRSQFIQEHYSKIHDYYLSHFENYSDMSIFKSLIK